MQLTGSLRRCYGVGLIEVLIALFVIAVGVLGMAGLHNRSLQHNQAAYIHSRATFLAGDMLDRIRANKSLARTGSDYQVAESEYSVTDCLQASYPDSCETSQCSPGQLATYDLQQWKFHIACELPGTNGSVSFSDISGQRVYTIRLNFPDNTQGQPVNDVLLRGAL